MYYNYIFYSQTSLIWNETILSQKHKNERYSKKLYLKYSGSNMNKPWGPMTFSTCIQGIQHPLKISTKTLTPSAMNTSYDTYHALHMITPWLLFFSSFSIPFSIYLHDLWTILWWLPLHLMHSEGTLQPVPKTDFPLFFMPKIHSPAISDIRNTNFFGAEPRNEISAP